MHENKETVVGLDIGTSNIRVLVAEADRAGGDIRIIGAVTQPSRGIRKGEVVNIQRAVDSLEKVINRAEQLTGREIKSAFVGIGGGNIRGLNSRALIPVAKPRRGISQKDIDRSLAAAQAVTIPREREVIQVIPQEFAVDDRAGVLDPLGIMGTRLEARVHIITVPFSSVQNRIKIVNQAGMEVANYALQPLAGSLAALRREEQQAGVLLVDLGGGTTGYVAFLNETLSHSAVLGLGGDHLTNDISIGLKLLQNQAEKLKQKFGLYPDPSLEKEECTVPGSWGRPATTISSKTLSRIMELRMVEIFSQIRKDLEEKEIFRKLGSGVVLTGGGSLLKGVKELATRTLELPVRVGAPLGISGLLEIVDSPTYITALGLVKFGFQSLSCGGKHLSRSRGWGRGISGLKSFIGKYF